MTKRKEKPLQVGDKVRLKNSFNDITATIIKIYSSGHVEVDIPLYKEERSYFPSTLERYKEII